MKKDFHMTGQFQPANVKMLISKTRDGRTDLLFVV
jgi:hypothetical protein